MNTAVIITMMMILDTKSAKTKMKTISFDFGLSEKVLKGITPELVEKSSYGNYITKGFVSLIFQPTVDKLTMKIKALEEKDKTFDNGINKKNNILNNIVISVSLVGPGALIIMIICMILMKEKQDRFKKNINEIPTREDAEP